MNNTVFEKTFIFIPLKPAKVSEISEATAASSLAADKRTNFHIGNPVQDNQLQELFFQLLIAEQRFDYKENEFANLSAFLRETVWKASPYAPRGGYSSKQPHPLVLNFKRWLAEGQIESLHYSTGEKNTKREIMIGSGGISETLRVLLFSLNRFQKIKPVHIHLYNLELTEHLCHFPELILHHLPNTEDKALKAIRHVLSDYSGKPHYLILGNTIAETFRRKLRKISLEHPLFFIEISNAANHLSMAREAQMADRVLRFLTPAVFDIQFKNLPVIFTAGPGELIHLLETVHFELKGTPSVPEMELLNFLIDSKKQEPVDAQNQSKPDNINQHLTASFSPERIIEHAANIISNLSKKAGRIQQFYEPFITSKLNNAEQILNRVNKLPGFKNPVADPLSGTDALSLLHRLTQLNDRNFPLQIEQSLLQAFLTHHPVYNSDFCALVSGSARTALGLLGFHCGIQEVVRVDLSWTYAHCFPKVHTVPLNSDLSINIKAILDVVSKKIMQNPDWFDYGAVILNNPHNASGKIFNEDDLKELIKQLLKQNVRVIDDLSYQNVTPTEKQIHIKTLRELVNELHQNGYLTKTESSRLLTVHSFSKTDSFAGARIAFVHIPEQKLFEQFQNTNAGIAHNNLSILMAYLLYRNPAESLQAYWRLRNKIFSLRMEAIKSAADELPAERNPYDLKIVAPEGSMYPRLVIQKLPDSVSLDWLATQLATEGTGIIPLSTFAETGRGYELARKSFRLTLGGSADPEKLYRQTRRTLIDLNRLLSLESAKYKRETYQPKITKIKAAQIPSEWQDAFHRIQTRATQYLTSQLKTFSTDEQIEYQSEFQNEFLPFRISVLKTKLTEQMHYRNSLEQLTANELQSKLIPLLEKEFYKDNLPERQENFKQRLFDRTVHPTQMYALRVDTRFRELTDAWFFKKTLIPKQVNQLASAIGADYFGTNVAISSVDEGDELLMDLNIFCNTEKFADQAFQNPLPAFLSFWGDWDGSTRPSGQGHRLVAAVLLENIRQMARILELINSLYPHLSISPELLNQIRRQPLTNQKLWNLLNSITRLTQQLEGRYKALVRLDLPAGRIQNITRALRLSKDPVELQWQHNDRLERKMKSLRQQRRSSLETAFSLNKHLRKTLHSLLPAIRNKIQDPQLLHTLGGYRDLLKRFTLTPRIHQKMITSDDAFGIDTTVFNINEINEIGAAYGNPGLILGLQVSMSTQPEPLIELERKLTGSRSTTLSRSQSSELPAIWSIPLFEDADSVNNIENYLDRIWDYARHNKALNQSAAERFTEIICEIFIAGSDLSQQVSQAAAAEMFANAKYTAYNWLGRKNLSDKVRIKLGSGEPMQRQGGYYNKHSGLPAFIEGASAKKRLAARLNPSDLKSTDYARSPLRGIFAGGDLRTFQSNLMEHIRFLGVTERVYLLQHLKQAQHNQRNNIIAASEPLADTRLEFTAHSSKALKLLSSVNSNENYQQFLDLLTKNFRNILYGNDEDVLGIHIISYFISRALPALRDRPTERPSSNTQKTGGEKVVGRIAHTLPLSKHGTMLRAIGHHRSQTMILGINQLTSGLFRTINHFLELENLPAEASLLLRNNILPNFPVYDMLHTLRLFQDTKLAHFNVFETLFPSWNSAVIALREEMDLMTDFIPLLQKELVRRLGLNINAFFNGGTFNTDLLPSFRPDLAVLLQENIFNTDLSKIVSSDQASANESWNREVEKLLFIPQKIKEWRLKIWDLIREPIYDQVKSFNQLAYAITTLSQSQLSDTTKSSVSQSKMDHLTSMISRSLYKESDDGMKQFLSNSVKYLSGLHSQNREIPINVVRALRDVERILKIEQQALSKEKQKLLNFYVLQMARLAGENG